MGEKGFENRVAELNDRPVEAAGNCIVYWMQRSQRAWDNLALNLAIERANALGKPLLVYFGLFEAYPMASVRALTFMLEGLQQTAAALRLRGVGCLVRREPPWEGIVRAAKELEACEVVVDEDYLNIGRAWRASAAAALPVRLLQVDAETVVPARIIGKEEWGAYTIRPKILRALEDHFVELGESKPTRKWGSDQPDGVDMADTDPLELASSLNVDQDVAPSLHFTGGTSEAQDRLQRFIDQRLPRYAEERNDIGVEVTSDLSPYLHFGQVSSLRVALEVESSDAPDESIEAYLEQLIVRRELAINFCLYNPHYDTMVAAPDWALASLEKRKVDERSEVYTLEELERAQTEDELWNAAQLELVRFGKIHGYMRMVWAKKMLEWSPTPEDALARAIYLNDKYALDGRDPNGYANIAWCILGKHDRPFPDRPVFGRLRYMSTESTKRKTHWQDYLQRISQS